MRLHNPICTTLFILLILILIILVVCWIFNLPVLEGFYAKRNDRIRIYQSDEIFDPDEAPEIEDNDPDDNPTLFDPDQQPLLDNQMNNVVLRRRTILRK
jgi:hypothetical protein